MKGVKTSWIYTVCSYSFAVALSVAISSVFYTKNTNALQHEIVTLPLLSEMSDGCSNSLTGADNGCGNPSFQIRWTSDNLPSGGDKTRAFWFTSRVFNSYCTFVFNQDHYYSSPSYIIQGNGDGEFLYGLPSYRFVPSNPDDYVSCMQGVPFGSLYSFQTNLISHPDFDLSSLSNIPPIDRLNYNHLPPYYFSYSGVYRYHSIISDGLDYSHVLKLSDITEKSASRAYQLVIPLGMNQPDITGAITVGRNLTYSGQFSFNSSFRWRSDIGNNLEFKLNWLGRDSSDISNNTNHSGSVPCTVATSSLNDQVIVRYSCSFDSPLDVVDGQFWAYLYINDLSHQYIWEFDGDLTFSALLLTTDFDSSPGATLGREIIGNDAQNAPGSAYAEVPSDDWFSNLTNLFGFQFINPFAPLFDLFNDNSSCASIPIISGMLGSDQSTYCPWFSPATRAVLTPVMSLASLMLVFGFLVRWLGSSSGNLFEDSQNEEVANVNHSGFRRFKK